MGQKKNKKTRGARELKKGKRGTVVKYVTRNQALKRLQITLPDFRRLCILKGIYPREPKKKVHGKDKTYYYTKDILFLAHEPILNTFRQLKVFARKLKKAKAKQDHGIEKRLEAQKPNYTLNHIIKERYPTFVDALRDLDDALSMLHLFAQLPALDNKTEAQRAHRCARLCAEFQLYVARSRALRKVFVSIKGVYYQAEVLGQTLTWVVPHPFSQLLPTDVDYRVMLTFLDFYETLVKFINFKLYHGLGLRYPPPVDPVKELAGLSLTTCLVVAPIGVSNMQTPIAPTRPSRGAPQPSATVPEPSKKELAALQRRIAQVVRTETSRDADDPSADVDADADPDAEDADADDGAAESEFPPEGGVEERMAEGDGEEDEDQQAVQRRAADRKARLEHLFDGCVVFLSREVPRDSLAFVLSSLGGTVSLATPGGQGSGYPLAEKDHQITHQVVDRPVLSHKFLSREYVQPQWVYDSVNAGMLLPVTEYTPESQLPPHLSPFVDDQAEGYVPARRHYLERLKESAGNLSGADLVAIAEGRAPRGGADEEESDDDDEVVAEALGAESDDPSEAEEEAEYSRELAAEAQGLPYSAKAPHAATGSDQKNTNAAARKKTKAGGKTKHEKEAVEHKELAKAMMSKKQKRLYQRMQYGIEKRKEAASTLVNKRRKIDKEKAQAVGGSR